MINGTKALNIPLVGALFFIILTLFLYYFNPFSEIHRALILIIFKGFCQGFFRTLVIFIANPNVDKVL